MVYEEPYASWCLEPRRNGERYDASLLGMVRRDRNHPSVVIWGLLNETPDGPVFRHAASVLPALRRLDDSRMVMLNSGRWDRGGSGVPTSTFGPTTRPPASTHNSSMHGIGALGIGWDPGQLAFHPGARRVCRGPLDAPADERIQFAVAFPQHRPAGNHRRPRASQRPGPLQRLYQSPRGGHGIEVPKSLRRPPRRSDRTAFAATGNGSYAADTTALAVTDAHRCRQDLRRGGRFSAAANPAGPWSMVAFRRGRSPTPTKFALFPLRHLQRSSSQPVQPRVGKLGGLGGRLP